MVRPELEPPEDEVMCHTLLQEDPEEVVVKPLGDTGATSLLLTKESATRLGLQVGAAAGARRDGIGVQAASGKVLRAEPIEHCEVTLHTRDGEWVKQVIGDAYTVEGLARDIVGGPALSKAGFDAYFQRGPRSVMLCSVVQCGVV